MYMHSVCFRDKINYVTDLLIILMQVRRSNNPLVRRRSPSFLLRSRGPASLSFTFRQGHVRHPQLLCAIAGRDGCVVCSDRDHPQALPQGIPLSIGEGTARAQGGRRPDGSDVALVELRLACRVQGRREEV